MVTIGPSFPTESPDDRERALVRNFPKGILFGIFPFKATRLNFT